MVPVLCLVPKNQLKYGTGKFLIHRKHYNKFIHNQCYKLKNLHISVFFFFRTSRQPIRTLTTGYTLSSLFVPGDRHIVVGTKVTLPSLNNIFFLFCYCAFFLSIIKLSFLFINIVAVDSRFY